MRILVTGYHQYDKSDIVIGMIGAFVGSTEWPMPGVVVIDGGSTGADAIARSWEADLLSIVAHETHSYLDYPEDPDDYATRYRAVNEAMVASGADVCLAFKDGFDFTLETGMTEHCVKLAKDAGIPVYLVTTV